jgi:putative endonuclease
MRPVTRAEPPSEKRLKALRRGRLAETLCSVVLRVKGYRILARDYRVPVGEIDIIARRGRVLAAIEVKARDSLAAAAEAVSPRQRSRVARALQYYLKGRTDLAACDLRFDVMLVLPGKWPVHVRDAWREEGFGR